MTMSQLKTEAGAGNPDSKMKRNPISFSVDSILSDNGQRSPSNSTPLSSSPPALSDDGEDSRMSNPSVGECAATPQNYSPQTWINPNGLRNSFGPPST